MAVAVTGLALAAGRHHLPRRQQWTAELTLVFLSTAGKRSQVKSENARWVPQWRQRNRYAVGWLLAVRRFT
jgi:hypothetical protein